jgi:hypothetical protein
LDAALADEQKKERTPMTNEKQIPRDEIRNRIRAIQGKAPVAVEPVTRDDWAYVVISTADGPVVLANDGVELDHEPGVATIWRSEIQSSMDAVPPESRKAWLSDFVRIRRVFGDATIESIGPVRDR